MFILVLSLVSYEYDDHMTQIFQARPNFKEKKNCTFKNEALQKEYPFLTHVSWLF